MNSVEGLTVSDVIAHNDAVSALVYARHGDFPEILVNRVPDLNLVDLFINNYDFDVEISATGSYVVLSKKIVLKEKEMSNNFNTNIRP